MQIRCRRSRRNSKQSRVSEAVYSRLPDDRAFAARVDLIVALPQEQPSNVIHTIGVPYLPERRIPGVPKHNGPPPIVTADDAVAVEKNAHLAERKHTARCLSRCGTQSVKEPVIARGGVRVGMRGEKPEIVVLDGACPVG